MFRLLFIVKFPFILSLSCCRFYTYICRWSVVHMHSISHSLWYSSAALFYSLITHFCHRYLGIYLFFCYNSRLFYSHQAQQLNKTKPEKNHTTHKNAEAFLDLCAATAKAVFILYSSFCRSYHSPLFLLFNSNFSIHSGTEKKIRKNER